MTTIVRKAKAKQKKKVTTQWWAIGVAITLTLMLCLTINYRAFSELSGETVENENLEKRIQSVTEENLGLQEQIHYLRNDPATVEREAGKFGYRRPKQKVPVQTNK
jgi:hypothetical protein